MASIIEVTDIGPVKHVAIPVPEKGGIVVLSGRNGRGKSKTLEAVESVVSGRGNLSVRDGALRGEVTAFGAKVTVGRSTRRTGELEVTSLEGRLSIAELVDPKIKSPDAADSKRIKALIQLTGCEPNIADFYGLVGTREEFERTVGPNALTSDDYVLMAERIKRALEAEARKLEDQATNTEGRARGMLDTAEEVDEAILAVGVDELQRQFEQDVQLHNSLVNQKKRFALEQSRIEQANEKLSTIEKITPESLDAMKRQILTLEADCLDCSKAVEKCRDVLRMAELELANAQRAAKDAVAKVDHAVAIRQQQEALEAVIQPTVDDVAQETIAQAADAVEQSRKAIERAAVARRSIERRSEASAIVKQSGQLRKQADNLRSAGKETDSVLSKLVSQFCDRLRVEHGRLVTTTGRGTTYYSELSHGERWKIAIDIAADAVGSNGVIVIPQEAWEGLDDVARSDVASHVCERGVLVLTAECGTEDEVTASVYE